MELNDPDWSDPFREAAADRAPVRVCRLRLSDIEGDPLEALRPLTVPAEHARARRYRFDADRERHLAGRGLVRVLLAHRSGSAPRDISLVDGPHGKPRVNGGLDDGSAPEFNVAHTSDVVVAALGWACPVGIDVESQNREANVEGLVQRVLTETEQQRWRALPAADRSAFFLHVWTCKEAFLKATGKGLQRSPHAIECTFEGNAVVGLDDADGHRPPSAEASAAQWSVYPFRAADGIAGAVVWHHSGPSSLAFSDASRLVNTFSPP